MEIFDNNSVLPKRTSRSTSDIIIGSHRRNDAVMVTEHGTSLRNSECMNCTERTEPNKLQSKHRLISRLGFATRADILSKELFVLNGMNERINE